MLFSPARDLQRINVSQVLGYSRDISVAQGIYLVGLLRNDLAASLRIRIERIEKFPDRDVKALLPVLCTANRLPQTGRSLAKVDNHFAHTLRPLIVEGRQYFLKPQARLRFKKVCRVKTLYYGQGLLDICDSKLLCQVLNIVDIGAALDAPYTHRAGFIANRYSGFAMKTRNPGSFSD